MTFARNPAGSATRSSTMSLRKPSRAPNSTSPAGSGMSQTSKNRRLTDTIFWSASTTRMASMLASCWTRRTVLARASACCWRFCSVTSRSMAMKCVSVPAASRTGRTSTWSQ